MKTILFSGNFHSKKHGTLSPIERVVKKLKKNHRTIISSKYKNIFLKFLDFIYSTFFKKYDIIHIDTYGSNALFNSFVCSFIANIRNKKIIIDLRGGSLFEVYQKSYLKRFLLIKIFLLADKIISPSMFLSSSFCNQNIHVSYVPNTINLKKFSFSKKILPLG